MVTVPLCTAWNATCYSQVKGNSRKEEWINFQLVVDGCFQSGPFSLRLQKEISPEIHRHSIFASKENYCWPYFLSQSWHLLFWPLNTKIIKFLSSSCHQSCHLISRQFNEFKLNPPCAGAISVLGRLFDCVQLPHFSLKKSPGINIESRNSAKINLKQSSRKANTYCLSKK